jgi:hypothetical protein
MWQKYRNWMARSGPAFLVALIACSTIYGQDVVSNYLPGTDFSKYRTYKWVTMDESASGPDQILDSQIKRSIDSQLVANEEIGRTTESGWPGDIGLIAVHLYEALSPQLGIYRLLDLGINDLVGSATFADRHPLVGTIF